jgi:hypothetical protein
MSEWQFAAALSGYTRAHSSQEGMTSREQDEVWAWMMEKEGAPI